MISLLHITNFTLASSYSRSNCKGGGTAIYVKSGLPFDELGLYEICLEKEFEICGISSEIAGIGKAIILCCYRSPNSNSNVFIECLTDLLYNVYKSNHTIFLLGDFNIDPTRNKREYAKLCNALNVFGLTPRVKWPTRVTYSAASTIDNIFSNCSMDSASLVIDNNISDHRTVLFDCGDNPQQVTCHTMNFIRSFTDPAFSNFISDISTEDWLQEKITQSDNPTKTAWHTIHQILNKNKHRKNITIIQNDTLISDDEKIAELFNEYFVLAPISITSQINSNISYSGINSNVSDSSSEDDISEDELLPEGDRNYH
nr:unnamed protein product [Callosobruchus analis]